MPVDNKDKKQEQSTFKWFLEWTIWIIVTYYAIITAYRCNKHESTVFMVLMVVLASMFPYYYLAFYFVYHFLLRVPCAMHVGNSTVLV
jgi:hypothetical protein